MHKREKGRQALQAVCTGAFLLGLLGGASAAEAQVTAWLDFTDFQTRLNTITTAAGAASKGGNFSNAEVTTIENNIQTQLGTIYQGFTLNFVQAQPAAGNYERIHLGAATGNPNQLGRADTTTFLDWRNQTANDNANVFTGNFGFAITGADRATVITNVSMALANASAHELGHDLGLQHLDAYGDLAVNPATYANTKGIQNTHIMSEPSTGATPAQSLNTLTLSNLETAKLEYSKGLTASTPASDTTIKGGQATADRAFELTFKPLVLSGDYADNVISGTIASGADDWFTFSAGAGTFLTANTISTMLQPTRIGTSIDTDIFLYGADGKTLITFNNDIAYQGNVFNGGMGRGSNAILLNQPLKTGGVYFLRVHNSSPIDGNYELFVTLNTPEPDSVALCVGLALSGAIGLRRRRKGKTGRRALCRCRE